MSAPNGRPREYDRDAIALALVEWAKQPDSINLNKFCALNSIPPSYITRWGLECNKFQQAYELAKTYIGFRREEMLSGNMLHVKAYDLNATTYDYFLKDERRLQSDFDYASKLKLIQDEAKLKAELGNQTPEETKEQLHALLSLIASTQTSRKIDLNKIKTEIKS